MQLKILAPLLGAFLLFQVPCQAKEYSFDELVSKALEQNYSLKQNENTIVSYKLSEAIAARNLYLPKLSWSLNADRSDRYKGFLIDKVSTSKGTVEYGSVLAMQYNLFNGFKDYYLLEEGEINSKKSRHYFDKEVERIVYNLKTVFLDLSKEINELDIIKDQLDRDKKLLRAAQIKFKTGLIAKAGLERSRMQFLQARSDLIAQKNIIAVKKVEIQNIINSDEKFNGGIRPYRYMNLDKSLLRLIRSIESQGVDKVTEKHFKTYLRVGTDLRLLSLDYQRTQAIKNQVQAGFLPTLSMEVDHFYNKNKDSYSGYNDYKKDYMVLSVNLSIPLFDSFDTVVRHRQERLEVVNAEHKVHQNRILTKNKIRELCRNIATKFEIFEVSKEKFKISQFVYSSAFTRFNVGAITIKQLIDDKLALQREGLNLVRVSNTLRKLHLELEKITGKLKRYQGA